MLRHAPEVDRRFSFQFLAADPGRTVVGDRHDDDCWLRRHDAENVPRHGRRLVLRADGRPDDSTSGSGDRVQLRAVLLAHAGARKAAKEAAEGSSGGAGATEDRRRWRGDHAADKAQQRRHQVRWNGSSVDATGTRRPLRYVKPKDVLISIHRNW